MGVRQNLQTHRIDFMRQGKIATVNKHITATEKRKEQREIYREYYSRISSKALQVGLRSRAPVQKCKEWDRLRRQDRMLGEWRQSGTVLKISFMIIKKTKSFLVLKNPDKWRVLKIKEH